MWEYSNMHINFLFIYTIFLSHNKVEICTNLKILHTQAPYFGIGQQGKDLL